MFRPFTYRTARLCTARPLGTACHRPLLRSQYLGHSNALSTSVKRQSVLEAGDDKTGHLEDGPDKALFYFDNVYPLRLAWLFRLPWHSDNDLPTLIEKFNSPSIARTNPRNIIKEHFKEAKPSAEITEVVPRVKEGGAYVRFTIPDNATPLDVEESLKKYLRDASIKPWWSPLQRIRARLVHGKPWVEDLYRMPSPRIKVEFLPGDSAGSAVELNQEQLYEYFRPYGKLVDIVPQPFDSKVLPKYALLDFATVRRAAMAKNCLHGMIVPESHGGGKAGTLLKIAYERKVKPSWVKEWLFGHPRIVIPIVAALLAGLTVAVFDPIRTFFIKLHIKHTFSLADSRIWRWFRSQASDVLSFMNHREHDMSMDVIWDDRRPSINQLQSWFSETADTFIIVQGARGSGKKELVNEALKKRKYKLIIDCKPIQEARGEGATIRAAAAQVGFRPVFSFMNTVSGWLDLAAQGATGVKTGFSETLEAQVQKIFNNTASALKQIALECRSKKDGDHELSDDEWLEAHPEKRVVVVVDNFLHKSQEGTLVYDKLAEWAATLTTSNIAHVVFLTHDVSFSKSLSKALPDRVFRQLALSDSTPEAAKRFVLSKIDAGEEDTVDPDNPEHKLTASQRRKDLTELNECIDTVGGRLTDLEFLARRIKMGETPRKAVREIVGQSASEILKMYLYNQDESSSGQRRWTPTQAWTVIEQLAASEKAGLRYNELILDDVFKSSNTGSADQVLQALEQAELISILPSSNGRPQTIRPGKPVYHAAFQLLTKDKVLSSRLNLLIVSDLIKAENANISSCETELKVLGDLPRQPYEITSRVKWLLGKIQASQMKVEKWELDQAALKGVLKTDF
ncbi:hypothetical protein BT63DRAFT_452121 [Microthyrium microscopicum]|uniref:Mitochondrial escape protein 2 n=1 Tax=Microthyrium microscopicum TaxID=703497 RepID=A0A6A6UH62_9PEZI|nr:hypothetical protein BT63DRAFT_452121 [Microthyrium microscopicum]